MVSSSAYPDLERAPGKKDNWVEASGGLPRFIERVAKHIHYEGGKPISTAIAMAISQVRKWAAKGNKEAIRAIAQWEALKGKNKARQAVKLSARRILAVELGAKRGPYERHVTHTKQHGRKKGDLKSKADWRHGYQPMTKVAYAVKAKHLSTKDLTPTGKPKAGKQDEMNKPVPPHLTKSKTDEVRTSAEKTPVTKNTVTKPDKKTPSKVTLKARRSVLEKKITNGTASPAERAELNRVIAQLKKTTR